MFICCLFICLICGAQGGTIARAVQEAGKTADLLIEKLISRAQNWEEAADVLGCWPEVCGRFYGKREYLTKRSLGPDVSRLSENARELLNDWQAWTPWVCKDLSGKIALKSAEVMIEYAEKLRSAAEDGAVEPPYFKDCGQTYLLCLASPSLDPFVKEGYEINNWLHDPNTLVAGKGGEVPVKGLPGNPSFFPISEEDFLDCLDFRMTPLKIFWDDVFEPTDEQNWRAVWDSVLYKWLAVCGQKNQILETVVTSGLQHYIGVGAEGRRDSYDPSFFSQKDIKEMTEYNIFIYALQSLNRRFEIHPIPVADFLLADRSMILRFAFWFCSLHRLNAYIDQQVRGRDALYDRKQSWSLMQLLLAQRLLAGEKCLLSAAEMFAFFDVKNELSDGLFTRISATSGEDSAFLEKDRAFFALQDKRGRKKSPSGLVLTEEEIQGVLVEAALEEVMLACDDIFEKLSLTDERKEGYGYIRKAFDAVTEKLNPIKNSVGARLQYALRMLYFAYSNYGPALISQEGKLKCMLQKGVGLQEWTSGARAAFLMDLKKQLAKQCHCEYTEIKKLADAALTKLIPEILKSFPVVDEQKRSVRFAPMPVKKMEDFLHDTVIKVKVKND